MPEILMPTLFFRASAPKPTDVYKTYWRFAAERQSVFFRRFRGEAHPWTEDPILQQFKFTNAYRASDRVSQYLIKHVIYDGKQSTTEVFFRTILFKFFNRIDTWRLLRDHLGEITQGTYSFSKYDDILTQAMEHGKSIFSAAYVMPSGAGAYHDIRKHRNYLRLLEKLIEDGVQERLFETESMQNAFALLRSYPMMGDFLAYQYIIDLNYSGLANFSEMEFVVPGPGARSGLRKCFSTPGDLSESELIRYVTECQDDEFSRLDLEFQSLWGRRLHLVDCQNLFCEVDKYARIAHPLVSGIGSRKKIKQCYRSSNLEVFDYWYPPKWQINEFVSDNHNLFTQDRGANSKDSSKLAK